MDIFRFQIENIQNFPRQFQAILKRANVKPGKFHDLRRTAIRNWFVQGLKELEVMTLAGHADFKTMHKFYLDISNDLKKRAKQAVSKGLCKKLVQIGASSNLTNKADEVKCVNACIEMT